MIGKSGHSRTECLSKTEGKGGSSVAAFSRRKVSLFYSVAFI